MSRDIKYGRRPGLNKGDDSQVKTPGRNLNRYNKFTEFPSDYRITGFV